MSNAIKALIERQAATSGTYSPSRVLTGHECSLCDNSFRLGDLRLSLEGVPESRRVHFFCALDQNPRDAVLDVDLVWKDDKTDPHAIGLHEAGLAIVEELREILSVLGDRTNLRATMARLLVTGYMAELTMSRLLATGGLTESTKASP